MNSTKTLTIVAIFMAATLVVGTFAVTTTQLAYAYQQKKKGGDNGKGNGNDNTVTIEECKNRGSASGFDTALDQECQNLICTHPGNNATCVQEGAVAVTPTTTPVIPVTPVNERCLSVQPATVFDVTTTQSLPGGPLNSGTVVCLGKSGENNPQNFPPGAAIITPGGTIFTGATVRIANSFGDGECPNPVTATVDSGNPPAGFNIGDTACITFFSAD